jgi:hypothetical protein
VKGQATIVFRLAPIDASFCDQKDTKVLALTGDIKDARLFYAAQRKNATTTSIVQLKLTTATTAETETLFELSFPDPKAAVAVGFYLPNPTSGFYTIVHQIEQDDYEIVLSTVNITTKARRDQLFAVPDGVAPIGIVGLNGADDTFKVLYTTSKLTGSKTRYSGNGLLGNGTLAFTGPGVSLGEGTPVFAMQDATLADSSWATWTGVGAKAKFDVGQTAWFFPSGPGVDGPNTPWYTGDASIVNGAHKTTVLSASCTKC